jgi:hypothetical protein
VTFRDGSPAILCPHGHEPPVHVHKSVADRLALHKETA